MQEHIGKKRRKEIREAETLLHDRNKTRNKCVAVFGGVIVACIVIWGLAFVGVLAFDNPVVLMGPITLIVVSLFFAGADIPKVGMKDREYKKYCKEHSVTDQDIAELQAQS